MCRAYPRTTYQLVDYPFTRKSVAPCRQAYGGTVYLNREGSYKFGTLAKCTTANIINKKRPLPSTITPSIGALPSVLGKRKSVFIINALLVPVGRPTIFQAHDDDLLTLLPR